MTINAYPLQWPVGWKRATHRPRAAFRKGGGTGTYEQKRLTVADGVKRVRDELRRMDVMDDDLVVSTNVQLRLDGWPRSDQSEPGDPGVAVYWQERFGGARRVMAIDRYDRVADNLAAVAATLEAMRAIERHGGAVILERAFTGFTALPAPGSKRSWREVFAIAVGTPSANELDNMWRRLRSSTHPDKGGSNAAFAEVNVAYEQAKVELGFE